jgi:mRNA interferase RelE/StbE
MFKIFWDEKAFEELNKLEAIISRRIAKIVSEMANDPFTKDIKKLKGCDWYRLRVGDYRIIFAIEEDTIHVLKVGHRKHIYD